MKEYIYLLKENIFWTFWLPTVDNCDENLKVLMDTKQDSFTKRWQVSRLFLNH